MNRIIVILFLLCSNAVVAQIDSGYVLPAKVVEGDTIPLLVLEEVTITPGVVATKPPPKIYNKLIADVKYVYPYAVIAGVKLKEANDIIAKTTNQADKRKKMKALEDDMKKQFTDDVENMTYSQGKILLKLIYRQTGVTSYEIVKELRGSLRAIFYQALARLFTANLKVEYDAKGEDKAIEDIVEKIESGEL
jgi:hypothetical protein